MSPLRQERQPQSAAQDQLRLLQNLDSSLKDAWNSIVVDISRGRATTLLLLGVLERVFKSRQSQLWPGIGDPAAVELRHMGEGQEGAACGTEGMGVRELRQLAAGHVRRAADVAIAWYWHCRACCELVAGQLDLVVDQPGGAFIQIYRCKTCGTYRSCRPRWRTPLPA